MPNTPLPAVTRREPKQPPSPTHSPFATQRATSEYPNIRPLFPLRSLSRPNSWQVNVDANLISKKIEGEDGLELIQLENGCVCCGPEVQLGAVCHVYLR